MRQKDKKAGFDKQEYRETRKQIYTEEQGNKETERQEGRVRGCEREQRREREIEE
jgi:hypothetical protein